ncbi:MAG: DUF2817 domain-containing protein [Planctomycetes bacterium]|nr:DUF2817 domain-containing protein [Planctomycetota bacterium]
MPGSEHFSGDYAVARARFRSAAEAVGATLEAHPIGQRGPQGEDLCIDAAVLGSDRPRRTVVVSSGLHGVEGFVGSAVQHAVLTNQLACPSAIPSDVRVVILHALNPYGFAWVRRVNERNVDLNRNFLRPGERFGGAPDGYAELDGLLNPRRAPRRLSLLKLKAALKIARHGMGALKNSVAGGQYEYPLGLFYGGAEPQKTQEILAAELGRWIGSETTERVYHVDLHSGLGPAGSYKLLVDHPAGAPAVAELSRHFGSDVVQPWEPNQGVAYEITGGLGTWCQEKFPDNGYDVLVAEYGTRPILEVIEGLHHENRAHHWGGGPTDPSTLYAKRLLMEAFAPSDPAWRQTVVPRGEHIVKRALLATTD